MLVSVRSLGASYLKENKYLPGWMKGFCFCFCFSGEEVRRKWEKRVWDRKRLGGGERRKSGICGDDIRNWKSQDPKRGQMWVKEEPPDSRLKHCWERRRQTRTEMGGIRPCGGRRGNGETSGCPSHTRPVADTCASCGPAKTTTGIKQQWKIHAKRLETFKRKCTNHPSGGLIYSKL